MFKMQFINRHLICTSLLLVNWLVICSSSGQQLHTNSSTTNNSININSTIKAISSPNLKANLLLNTTKANSTTTINPIQSTVVNATDLTINHQRSPNLTILSQAINRTNISPDSSLARQTVSTNLTTDLSIDSNFTKLDNYTKTILTNNTELNLKLNKETILESNVLSYLVANRTANSTPNSTSNQAELIGEASNKQNELVKKNTLNASAPLSTIESTSSLNHVSNSTTQPIDSNQMYKPTRQDNTSLLIKGRLTNQSTSDQASSFSSTSRTKIVKKDSVDLFRTERTVKNDSSAKLVWLEQRTSEPLTEGALMKRSENLTIKHTISPNQTIKQTNEHLRSTDSIATSTRSSNDDVHLSSTVHTNSSSNLVQTSTTIQPLHLSHAEPLISVPHSDQHWMIPNQLGKFFFFNFCIVFIFV